MTAVASVHELPIQYDPPLFRAQALKNKRRGKVVRKILAEFEYDELLVIADEAAEDVDFGWRRAI